MSWIVEIAPFVMIVCIVALFVGYRIVKLVLVPEQVKKEERHKKRAKHCPRDVDEEALDELIHVAQRLTHRVQNLEDILLAEDSKAK